MNWVRASNFAQNWALVRGYVGAGCSTVAQVNANANPGDFLAYMNGSTFEIWHIAFVHSKANGKISISQHTTNRYNQVWNNVIESDFMSKNSVNIIKFS